jgi:hypothetical protein
MRVQMGCASSQTPRVHAWGPVGCASVCAVSVGKERRAARLWKRSAERLSVFGRPALNATVPSPETESKENLVGAPSDCTETLSEEPAEDTKWTQNLPFGCD